MQGNPITNTSLKFKDNPMNGLQAIARKPKVWHMAVRTLPFAYTPRWQRNYFSCICFSTSLWVMVPADSFRSSKCVLPWNFAICRNLGGLWRPAIVRVIVAPVEQLWRSVSPVKWTLTTCIWRKPNRGLSGFTKTTWKHVPVSNLGNSNDTKVIHHHYS